MCGILCLYQRNNDVYQHVDVFKEMLELMHHRGPNQTNYIYDQHILLGHKRLSIIDVNKGGQPFEYIHQGIKYTIVYNGEIYNMKELKIDLINRGFHFTTQSDVEVLLVTYIAYQKKVVDYLEGIFSFVIYHQNQIFACRDHIGVKPLYYYYQNDTLIIASEIKSILHYLPKTIVTKEGLQELLALGPSISPGKTLYQHIYSLRAGHYLSFDQQLTIHQYFRLQNKEHLHCYKETVLNIRKLVNKSIEQQLLSDVPLSCMLSGGLDSSIITAVASQYISNLSTYSVTYEKQDEYFKAYDYQTTQDDEYIDQVVNKYQTNHQTITLSQAQLAYNLKKAMIARDGPGMGDIDSSFLCFAHAISKQHKVVLSGECADELFGGYPWFYKDEFKELDTFPWIKNFNERLDLLSDFSKSLDLENYSKEAYQKSLDEIDYYDTNYADTYKRKMIYLNYQWFMQTLLTRADSQSMNASIELRVPFASKEIIEYMYNVPWHYMYRKNEEKGLLRDAFCDFLPEDIFKRKKNPYPKTHSPQYTKYVKNLLQECLDDKDSILHLLFDQRKLQHLIDQDDLSTSNPWFGQLMSGPQLLAYFYQIHFWAKEYKIELALT